MIRKCHSFTLISRHLNETRQFNANGETKYELTTTKQRSIHFRWNIVFLRTLRKKKKFARKENEKRIRKCEQLEKYYVKKLKF